MSKNKKILNAENSALGDITFRSNLEKAVYKKMISLGYHPSYEVESFELLAGFRPSKVFYYEGNSVITKNGSVTKIKSWKYTPDFCIEKEGYKFYIEAKGHPNELWPYKRKMFLKKLESIPNAYFFEVKTIRGLVKSLEAIEQIIKNGNA